MANPLYFFRKDQPFSELSNFAPYGFEENGLRWPTVEHYFQAQKFRDPEYRERIRCSNSPMEAKTLGQTRQVRIREDWEAVKEKIMEHALRLKFQNENLKSLLLSTRNRPLIEDSPHDRYWRAGKDRKGKNRLGVLLVKVRNDLQIGPHHQS